MTLGLTDAYYAGSLDAFVAAASASASKELAEAVHRGDLDAAVAYYEAHGGHFYGSHKKLKGGGASGGGIPDKAPDPGSTKQLGGSTGAQLVTVGGVPYVDKRGASPEHIREEAAANAVYGVMGVPVPPSRLIDGPDGPTQRAAFIGGTPLNSYLTTASPAERAAVIGRIQQGFATDALLANWDSVGLVGDNIIVRADGTPFRVDNGGSLRFRAQGAPKGDRFGGVVGELKTMTDPAKGSWATDMFAGIDKGALRSQVEALAAKRGAILAVLPAEVRSTVSARIDDMLAQTSPVREALIDAYLSSDVDALIEAAGDIVAEAHGGHFYGSRKAKGSGGGSSAAVSEEEMTAFDKRAVGVAAAHEGVMGLDEWSYVGADSMHTLIRVNSDIYAGAANPKELAGWDALFDQGVSRDHPVRVYRAGRVPAGAKVGDTFTDKGYSWTAQSRDDAVGYVKARNQNSGGSVRDLMRITIEPGTKYIPQSAGENSYVVLPRSKVWRVTGSRPADIGGGTFWDVTIGSDAFSEAHGGHFYGSRKALAKGGGGGAAASTPAKPDKYGEDPLGGRSETATAMTGYTRDLALWNDVADWPTTRPWELSAADIEAGKGGPSLRAVHYGTGTGNDTLASVTGTLDSGKININVDTWDQYPPSRRAGIMYHEVGHLASNPVLATPGGADKVLKMAYVHPEDHLLSASSWGHLGADPKGEELANLFAARWTTPAKLEQDGAGTITLAAYPKMRFSVNERDVALRRFIDAETKFVGAPMQGEQVLLFGPDKVYKEAAGDDRLVEALLDFAEAHAGHYFGSRKKIGKAGGAGGAGGSSTPDAAPAGKGGSWDDVPPPDVAAVITEYTDSEYIPINTYMREGAFGAYSSSYSSAEQKIKDAAEAKAELDKRGVPGEIAKMKSAVRPTPEPMTLYRGTHGDSFGLSYNATPEQVMTHVQGLMAAGEPLADKAFMSASVGTENLFWGGSQVRMQIKAPAGTPAINVNDLAKYKGEREVILDGGVRWRVTGASLNPASMWGGMNSPAHVLIEVEVVP